MLQIKNICKEYKTGDLVQKALDNVSLNLRDNEFVAILGPSGSGKTTLLNIIGGLDRYDSGDLIINDISTKKYKDKDWDSYRNHTIGFVFQSYNLIPHQNILANVELALTISGVSKKERRNRAVKALEEVGLKEQIHKKPNQLSGGQMQRVAIARALVNNPDILLADEPTGALDSDTSVQVMELLKKVAKDRLVVMVTHNPELAEEYATRIVKLRDGEIKSDTNPFEPKIIKNEELKTSNMGKTSMSFFTSLALSFNNLKTKKGRTFLTAFAGSIGIIGIALVLSLSNGVNKYIQSIEEDTLSEYPIQITDSGFDFTSMISEMADATKKAEETEEGKINIIDNVSTMFSSIGTNDLTSLKEYLESDKSNIKEYSKAIEYSYNVEPIIYSSDTDKLRKVNPDVTFSSLGLGTSTSSNSIMSSMMSTNVFYQMPTDSALFENQYEVKAGNWPKNYNECVLVLTSDGSMTDFLLYTLGLRDFDELDKMVEQFTKEEDVEKPEISDTYNYDDILNKTFKLVNAPDCYEYDKQYKVWKDKSDNEKYMKDVVKNSEEIKIVGIIQPKSNSTATMLRNGIYYPASLTKHIIEKSSKSKIVKAQIDEKDKNVFTGKEFSDDSENKFDMKSLIQIDSNAMKNAFKVDQSKLKMKDIDFSNVLSSEKIASSMDMSDVFKNMDFSLTETESKELVTNIWKGFEQYLSKNNITDYENMNKHFTNYLQSDYVKQMINLTMMKKLQEQNIETKLSKAMESYTNEMMKTLSKEISKQMQSSVKDLGKSMSKAITVDTKAFASAIKINMGEEELKELITSLMSKEKTSYEANLKKLNYADYNEPDEIDIYPKNFEGNEEIKKILDNYNESVKENGEEEKVISYTDIVGTMMSSVTKIVDIISYVLIAFIAISLVVSSIMIGVITYISVLERKKEIGILRAIGASKRNISQVFNAETFIIGVLSGAIGVGISLLILIPANKIIQVLSNGANIKAVLPLNAGIILIVLSTLLTMIGGIIPSKKAAKEDPVLALRSE